MFTYHMTMLDLCKSVFVFLEMLYSLIFSYMFIFSFFDCYIPLHRNLTLCIIWACARYAKNALEKARCLHACLLLRLSYISMGNGLEQWRASIGLFNSKCIIKQRVRVNVSMAYHLIYMMYFLKWAVSSTSKLLSFVFNEMECNLFFKIVLILELLETGDIEMNPGPYNINNSLSILHSNIRSICNKYDYLNENFLDFMFQ